MTTGRLRVAVVGTGSWAQRAHIPGWQRDPQGRGGRARRHRRRGAGPGRGEVRGAQGRAPTTANCSMTPDIDVIDVVTGNRPHYQVSWDALQAGKHVLCEKPVHPDYRKTREAAELAAAKGLKTKLGLHVPVRAGRPVRQAADRRGLRRRAVHVQRLRAEQPVDRPGHAAAPGRPARRSRADRGLVDRGLRRADHRHHALVARLAAAGRRRHDAQLRPDPHGPRHRAR